MMICRDNPSPILPTRRKAGRATFAALALLFFLFAVAKTSTAQTAHGLNGALGDGTSYTMAVALRANVLATSWPVRLTTTAGTMFEVTTAGIVVARGLSSPDIATSISSAAGAVAAQVATLRSDANTSLSLKADATSVTTSLNNVATRLNDTATSVMTTVNKKANASSVTASLNNLATAMAAADTSIMATVNGKANATSVTASLNKKANLSGGNVLGGTQQLSGNLVLSNSTGTAVLRPTWNSALRVTSGVVVDGETTVSALNTTGNYIYLNRDGPNADGGVYVYSGGSSMGSSILWNNSLNRFVVNKAVNITGDLFLSTAVYSGSGYYDYGNGLYLGVGSSRPVYFRNSTGPANFTTATAQGLWQMARISTKILAHATGTTSYVVVGGASDYLSTGTTAMDWSLPPIRTQWNSQTTGTVTSEYTFFNGTNQTCSIEPYRHTGSVYDSTFWLAGVTYRELTLSAGAVVTVRAAPSPRHVWLVKSTQGTVGGR